jgi:hypothetical protein
VRSVAAAAQQPALSRRGKALVRREGAYNYMRILL